jgi:GT2 family glycosyltransferase
MQVSVAVSTRDRPQALARCLASLAEAPFSPSDVVIVDQSDDDRGAQVSERCTDMSGFSVLHIRQHERGLAVAQNAGIAAAASDVVAVTDDDCVVDARWLEVVAEAFERDPELGLLTGRVLPLATDDPSLVPVSIRPSALPVSFVAPADPWEIGSGNNFAVRRRWFDAVGGCDVRLGPGTPGRGALDMDLFYRLVRAGAPARYEPGALVFHEQKPRAERRSRRPDYGFGMGACCMFWRRDGDPNALRILGRWLRFRARLLLHSLGRGRIGGAYEETLMLVGTLRGVMYGYAHAR